LRLSFAYAFAHWLIWRAPVTKAWVKTGAKMTTSTGHIGIMHPVYYESLQEMGTGWERPHPGPFYWNTIQSSQGADYYWTSVDQYVTTSQAAGQSIVATIWPYADWDQSGTYTALTDAQVASFPEIGSYRHHPVNTTDYTNFVKALVERYDGDRVDDMSGLTQAINLWEVANEPALTDTIFFDGTAAEYYSLLQLTHDAVAASDSTAQIMNGGMAGASTEIQAYWQTVLDLGGSQYIDVFSFHSISQGMDLDFPSIKTFLSTNNMTQDVWITEVELEANALVVRI
jgi:hypothetical protein